MRLQTLVLLLLLTCGVIQTNGWFFFSKTTPATTEVDVDDDGTPAPTRKLIAKKVGKTIFVKRVKAKTLTTTATETEIDKIESALGSDNSTILDTFDNSTIVEEPELPFIGTEDLCVRVHNNTAFEGIEPYDTLLLKNAYDCQKACVAAFPRCVAVMFYFLANQTDGHLCYQFDHNSIDPDVQLIPEAPKSKRDVIRALEIVYDCHQFDPFPPLGEDGVVTSSDKVPRSKRESGHYLDIKTQGSWSNWGKCMPSGVQARSQACEYGRKIQRRGCSVRNYYVQFQQQQAANQYQDSFHAQTSQNEVEHAERARLEEQRRQQQQQQQQQQQEQQRQQQQKLEQQRQQHQQLSQFPQYTQQQPQYAQGTQRIQPQLYTIESTPRPAAPVSYPPQPYNHNDQRAEIERQRADHEKEYARRQEEYNRLVEERRRLEADRAREAPQHSQPSQIIQPAAPVVPTAVYGAPQYVYPQVQNAGADELHPAIPPEQAANCTNTLNCLPRRPPPPPPPACRSAACIPTKPPLGQWLEWSDWSSCSCSCDDGIKQRRRYCSTADCGEGDDVETQFCNLGPCETWSEWCEWSTCSTTCGKGQKSRERFCLLGTQRCDGNDFESLECDAGPCPEWSQWEGWGQCSTSCGQGIQSRQRTCLGGAYGALQCSGEKIENRPCNHGPCSYWGSWQEWSPCSVTCGDGAKTRSRICQGGTDCVGESTEDIFCSGPPCAAWTFWAEWSSCSSSCGPGQKTRQRLCQTPDGRSSENCLGDKVETILCEEGACATWSEWCEWSPCDRDCGGGVSLRSRVCEAPGSPYGDNVACPGPNRETKRCNEHACAPQCQWTEWCPWSPCTAYTECDSGVSQRNRQCVGEAGCSCRGLAEESQQCHGMIPCTPPPPPAAALQPC